MRMAPKIVLFLTLTLGLTAEAACAAEPASRAAAFTPARSTASRDRLDRMALALPGDSLAEDAFRSVEDLPFRLLTADGVEPDEEAHRAAAANEPLLDGRMAAPTPAAVQRLFDRLVAELPRHLNPTAIRWRLTVLDLPARDAFTTGGGYVYIDRRWMEALLADPERGEAALAFVLANEIGHVVLGHTRRRWAEADIPERIRAYFSLPLLWPAPDAIPRRFVYTGVEQGEADRFALHLCRNAGLDLDAALDAVRIVAAPPSEDGDSQIASTALIRLRRLLMERDGLLDDETSHGLFLWNRETGRLVRCAPRQIGPGERPIVLVHGMRGTDFAMGSYVYFLAKQPETADRPLLIFHYPNNDSISRSGQFLTREMRRVVAEPEKAVFVCHSAGGLVVRWYTEVRKGGFDRVIFLATPHAGTRMAEFKVFVDVGRFFLDLPYGGLAYAFSDEFGEGDGQIAADLHPDSLFLRRLGQEMHPVARYQIFYGQVFNWLQALELQAGFAVAKALLKEAIVKNVPFHCLQDRLTRLVDDVPLPEEITRGDLAVSVRSALLPGVTRTTSVLTQHEAFRYDPEIMRQVLAAILEP
jgi:pimeloyl-ACP methyl ester carboxylesterase